MAPKRARESAVVTPAIAENSNAEDCLEWLGSILTTAQFKQVEQSLKTNGEPLDGAFLFGCDEGSLKELGLSAAASKKVHSKLQEVRADRALIAQENSPLNGGSATPLVDADASLDLATAGPTSKRGRARDAPRTNRQTRLTPLDLEGAAAGGSGRRTRGGARTTSRLNKASTAATDNEVDQQQSEDDEDVIKIDMDDDDSDVDDVDGEEYAPEGDDAAMAVDDDEATEDEAAAMTGAAARRASRRRSRATSSRRSTGSAGAGAGTEMAEQADVEEEEDNRPETPDDGVGPQGNDDWKVPAFEGLPIMLKMLSQAKLVSICEEKEWESKVWRYKKKDPITGATSWKDRSKPSIATHVARMLFWGDIGNRRPEDGGTTWDGVDEFIAKYFEEEQINDYLNETLKRQVATPPRITDPRKMLWRLWARKANAPTEPLRAHLGRITVPCAFIGNLIKERWQHTVQWWEESEAEGEEPWIELTRIIAALEASDAEAAAAAAVKNEDGSVPIKDEGAGGAGGSNTAAGGVELSFIPNEELDYPDILAQLFHLQRYNRGNIKCRCRFDMPNKLLFLDLDVEMKKVGEVLVRGAFTKRSQQETGEFKTELIQVWFDRILQAMDHLRGTDVLESELEKLNVEWDEACDDLEQRNVPLEIDPPNTVTFNVFDKIMAGVEDLGRDMLEGVEEECEERIALRLKPYQKNSLSFMLSEERAENGTARHLWLRIPLAGDQNGLQAWVSPSLFQLYVSKSEIATQQALGTRGGAGWIALEMGMGKTAVVLAGTLLNPPPQNWRESRPWKAYDPQDYMSTYVDNMPRGGTLVVVPITLVRQWQIEIEKTLDNPEELNVLVWTDVHRTMDCNEIARYDVVLTTPQMTTKTSTLPSIFWHRVVIDEAQLNAGSLMKGGTLLSTHRWIVTGTPCNADPSSLSASLDFLRLGGYDIAQKHLPPALATVLRAVMCRYTKSGTINGQTNLELPPLNERLLAVQVSEKDTPFINEFSWENWQKLYKHIKGQLRFHQYNTVELLLQHPEALNELVQDRKIKIKTANKHMKMVKDLVGGGRGIPSGETYIHERTGREIPIEIYMESKALAVVEDLLELREKEPEAKVLVFSEYAPTLNSIANILAEEDLQHRMLLGNTTAKKRGEAIEAFMTDPPTRIFLLQAKAGGVGITLTAASHVYLCEPLLNPGLELQAIGRSRRMGQTKTVTVTRVYAENTIEERLRAVLERRCGGRNVASTAGAAGADEAKCSIGDIAEMLKCDDPYASDDEDQGDAADEDDGEEYVAEGGF